ncbi:MAG: response regulator [Verrucomicrobiales bacterium]|nr:response regulator [Verrucomicrobiales bacterium]
MNEQQMILLVDDSDNDLSLMRSACRAANFQAALQMVNNGDEAISYLRGEGEYSDRIRFPLPTVMLLDLKMPMKDGFEVLRWVREQPVLKRLCIIILTASARPEDVTQAFDLGANSYLVKPAAMSSLIAMVCCLRDWLEYNRFPRIQQQ